jgi:hypothetical protein
MSKFKDTIYDIQEMFIDGADAKHIAFMLKIPLEEVQKVLNSFGVSDEDIVADEPYSPHITMNS